MFVEPSGGLHRRHEHLMAQGIEQNPPQLLDVRADEIEERGAGLRLDSALQGGDGFPVLCYQLDDDGRIGLDGSLSREWGGRPRTLFPRWRDEVCSLDDGL